MSQARTAAGNDRLPWLADEPVPPNRRRSHREAAGWAVAAAVLLAAASYWVGERSWREPAPPIVSERGQTTVALPSPRAPEPPQPQVVFEPAPEVSPVPERQVPIVRPRPEKLVARPHSSPAAGLQASSPASEEKPSAATPDTAPAPGPAAKADNSAEKPLTLWPAWQSQGAAGRIVRIGAFGSRLQAKVGWRYMVRAYPAVAHLPATVVETRNSRGRAFYRFQIGTTSQAHSEVLCQRMEKIRLSCAVVGLPWKPKGVER
jgi:outer membrane biosynthesis protein TonB